MAVKLADALGLLLPMLIKYWLMISMSSPSCMDPCVISEIVNAAWQELPLSVHSQENKVVVQEMAPRHDSNKTTSAQLVTSRTY